MTRRHPVEAAVRGSIATVMTETGETRTMVGAVTGISVTLVGRRQRGLTPWTLAEVGQLADHWQVPVAALVAGPSETLRALPLERLQEIRGLTGRHVDATRYGHGVDQREDPA